MDRKLVTAKRKRKRNPRNKNKINHQNIQPGISNNTARITAEFCANSSIKKEYGSSTSMRQELNFDVSNPIGLETSESISKPNQAPFAIKTENYTPVKMPKNEHNDPEMIYTCCRKKFSDKFVHFQHMIFHTDKAIRLSAFGNIKCDHCDQYFKSEQCVVDHMNAAHVYNCNYCLNYFPTNGMLTYHLRVAHNIIKYNTNLRRWYQDKPKNTQSVKKIKAIKEIKKEKVESTADVKPDLAKVKKELITNIKTEPLPLFNEETLRNIKKEKD